MSAKHSFMSWEIEVESPTHKLVLLALANNANDDGTSWYSYGRMSNQTGLSKRSIMRSIAYLEDAGLLQVVRRRQDKEKNQSNIFRLTLGEAKIVPHSHPGSDRESPTLVTESHPEPNSTEPNSRTKDNGQSVGSTPRPGELKESIDKLRGVYQRSMIDEPEPKPSRLDTRENARALAELWNQVIDEHNPNWRKVSTPEVLSAKRERTAKQAINFAKARYKLKHNGTVPTWSDLLDWFTRYLEAAAHHEFHSGYHVSAQYPQGFRRDFDLQLRQSTMEKFVDENNKG